MNRLHTRGIQKRTGEPFNLPRMSYAELERKYRELYDEKYPNRTPEDEDLHTLTAVFEDDEVLDFERVGIRKEKAE